MWIRRSLLLGSVDICEMGGISSRDQADGKNEQTEMTDSMQTLAFL